MQGEEDHTPARLFRVQMAQMLMGVTQFPTAQELPEEELEERLEEAADLSF